MTCFNRSIEKEQNSVHCQETRNVAKRNVIIQRMLSKLEINFGYISRTYTFVIRNSNYRAIV